MTSRGEMFSRGSSLSTERPPDEHQDGFLTTTTMKMSCFSGPFLLLFLCGTGSALGSVVVKEYWYSRAYYTWHEAQSQCSRSTSYTDLATIFEKSDEGRLSLDPYEAWVGLHRSPYGWIWPGGSNYYGNWAPREPSAGDDCTSVFYNNDRFYGTNCERYSFFFCQKPGGSTTKTVFVAQAKTQADAQEYCKTNNYVDLAYLPGSYYVSPAVRNKQDFPVWIGLHREGGAWKWSSGSSEYRNWAPGEPSDRGDCVSVSSEDKKMSTQSCSARFPMVCSRDNLVLVKENKTWEESLVHCRGLVAVARPGRRHDLVSVQPGGDHRYVAYKVKEADTEEVWTGLRFLGDEWLWVNAAAMLYADLPLCPAVRLHCGVLAKNDSGGLLPADCTERRNFLCYGVY